MTALGVAPVIGGESGHSNFGLVQLRGPDVEFSLRRLLADSPVLSVTRYPFGPGPLGPWLPSYRLHGLDSVEPGETVLHGGGPQMVWTILGTLGFGG